MSHSAANFARAIGRTGIGDVDAIAAAMAVEGHRVEHADQAGAEHGDAMHEEFLVSTELAIADE